MSKIHKSSLEHQSQGRLHCSTIDEEYDQNENGYSQVPENIKKKSSFGAVQQTKLQLSWRDITITAPPKRKWCRGGNADEEDKVILGA